MRYLDIAVAVLVGTTAITGIYAWSPSAGDAAASVYHEESVLRDWLLAFVQDKGMAWFVQASVLGICDATGGASNSTFQMSAWVGSARCPPRPPDGVTAVALSFELGSREVTLVSWSDGAR